MSPYAALSTSGAALLCGMTSTVGASVAPWSTAQSTFDPSVALSRNKTGLDRNSIGRHVGTGGSEPC